MDVILVFGRHGQVGSELMTQARSFGFEAVGIGSKDADITSLSSIEGLVRTHRPRFIFNAAAYTAVDKAESDADAAFSVNATAPALMAKAAEEAGIPFFHISTDYVFDGRKSGPYLESDSIAPLGVYGRSKAEGDLAVAAATARHIILRTSWVFGSHGANFVRTMIRLASEQPELRVVDDQLGRPTGAGDIAGSLLRIAQIAGTARGDEGKGFPWGIYHFANAGEVTWCGFARAIMGELERRGRPAARVVAIRSEDYPTAAVRPRNSVLDCSKIEKNFGISPEPWHTPLRRVMDDLLSNPAV